MKIICDKGYYKFYTRYAGEAKRFSRRYGVELVQHEDFFTFEELALLPLHSFKEQPLAGLVASANFSGTQVEVLTANKMSYNIQHGKITKIADILGYLDYSVGAVISTPEMPQAYFKDEAGQIISGFVGFLDVGNGKFTIERWQYEGV